MYIKKILIFVVGAFVAFGVKADEGMWIPALLNKMDIQKMGKLGAELTAEDIYSINHSSLKDAIIALDHGSCTGELVSPNGLFLTNHHCGYGEIQKHSSPENNYLKDGFWAQNKTDELPNHGKTVSFLIRVEDVTEQVNESFTDKMAFDDRKDSIKKVSAKIVDKAIEDTHYEARVKSLYESNRFYLFVYETFKDVRLVGAPPSSIGKFGADTDNWMWPRHTGDFALFRIYTGPDGKPAEYSEDNIPLKPRHYLPISLKGYDRGDFAMIMGYPGSTNRYLTSKGVEYTMNLVNKTRIDVREKKLEIMLKYMETSEKASIQYATKYARSSNYYKYSIGQNKGLTRLGIVNKKKAIEEKFTHWMGEDKAREEQYGNALNLIEQGYANLSDDKAYRYMYEAILRGPEILSFSRKFQRLLSVLESGDDEKIGRQIEKIKEMAGKHFKDYNADTDMKLLAALTKRYADRIDETYHPEFIRGIRNGSDKTYEKWARKVFRKSMFDSEEEIMEFLKNPKARKIEKDPAFKAAVKAYKMLGEIRKQMKEDREKLDEGKQLFLAGLLEMRKDKKFYPDANSTMRLTYGSIKGYQPRDAVVYNYFTTIDGYLEKEVPGDREFNVFPEMKKLILDKDFGRYASDDGNLYTCFLTNNDITGGNSGSPVMNGNGELIGIAFDGNWEAMSGDIAFEPELQRCINVDIRFVLWVIDKYAGAKHLVDEMTIIE